MQDDAEISGPVSEKSLEEENYFLRRQVADLENRLNVDPLTSTYSKAGFYKRFEDHAREGDFLYFIDIDNFKSVNDSYGHHIGDRLLVEIGKALVRYVASKGHVGRLAGDEFLLFIPSDEGVSEQSLSKDICATVLAATVNVGDLPVSRSASIGVAQVFETKNPEHAVINANAALRIAKANGKNRSQTFSRKTVEATKAMPSIDEVRRGLKRQEIGYFLQPIVDLKTGHTVGYEALIRWNRRNGEVLGPSHFLNNMTLAYNDETEPPLTAAHRVAKWAAEDQNKFISFNISSEFMSQVIQKGTDWISEIVGDIPRDKIVFELVETMIIEDSSETTEVISQLRKMGIRIALDDFGIGQSTLYRLQSIQVDYVKIDRSFLVAALHSERDEQIMRSITELIIASGAEAVVEGIEEVQQLDFAKALGASYGQGFLLGRPGPVSAWNVSNPDFPVLTPSKEN